MRFQIKDCRKVAYLETQGETAENIIASIDGAVSAVNVASAPYGRLYIVTLADGTVEVKKKTSAPIALAAHIHGSNLDLEFQGDNAIPIYMIDYLCYSQN